MNDTDDRVPSPSPADPRLQAAEKMCQRLSAHPGATPGTRRLAEELVAALRRVLEEAHTLEEAMAAGTGRGPEPAGDAGRASLDELDAGASDLLGALAALHGVIVRRDGREAARALIEAERTLSEVHGLEGGMRLVEGEEA